MSSGRSWVPKPGDRIRIERDEERYPSKGTWAQFRGRIGTVVEVNVDRKRPHNTEFGVVFGSVHPREERPGTYRWSGSEPVTWFKLYEMRGLGPQCDAERLLVHSGVADGDNDRTGSPEPALTSD